MGEIEKHLPTLLEVVETLQCEIPDLKVVIPAANLLLPRGEADDGAGD